MAEEKMVEEKEVFVTKERIKGNYFGVREGDELKFRVIGTYNTVRYGTLYDFVLLVPKDAVLLNEERDNEFIELLYQWRGKKYYVSVRQGDAYRPTIGTLKVEEE